MALYSDVEPPDEVPRMAASSAALSAVNPCAISTRLSKSITCARSCSRMRCAKPTAASCATSSRSSMLALVSMSSDSAIGRLDLLKYSSSCLAPSSKTVKSALFEVGEVAVLRVDDGHVQRHDVHARAEDLRRRLGRRRRRLLRGAGVAAAISDESRRAVRRAAHQRSFCPRAGAAGDRRCRSWRRRPRCFSGGISCCGRA